VRGGDLLHDDAHEALMIQLEKLVQHMGASSTITKSPEGSLIP
jgi:hypothetical protein